MTAPLPITGEPDADEMLGQDPLALLVGMLLDQQQPMEKAFVGPYRLKERLDGRFDAKLIAEMDPEELERVFKIVPAIHRFPGSMAKRTQALAQDLVESYDGDAAAIWRDVPSGQELVKRLKGLPGFGEQKAKIFAALLAKRFGVKPDGWEKATAPYSDDQKRSVADVDGPETLLEVRAWKKSMKAQGKTRED